MKQAFETTWDILKFAIAVMLLAFIFKAVVFQPFVVDGISMEPDYHNGEYIIVNKFVYKVSKPNRGDVIILRPPDVQDVTYIKRIIGLPGDTVKISGGNVYINGKILNEPYLTPGDTTITTDANLSQGVKLGDSEYWVMGDNRNHSSDSRVFGPLPKDNIVGKAWLIVYPKQYFGLVKHISYSLGITS